MSSISNQIISASFHRATQIPQRTMREVPFIRTPQQLEATNSINQLPCLHPIVRKALAKAFLKILGK